LDVYRAWKRALKVRLEKLRRDTKDYWIEGKEVPEATRRPIKALTPDVLLLRATYLCEGLEIVI